MNTWVCASCGDTVNSLDRIQHFINRHNFRPRQQTQTEETEVVGFFSENFHINNVKCPTCGTVTTMDIIQQLKSISITCGNNNCRQVKLYRLVVDRPPVQETVS